MNYELCSNCFENEGLKFNALQVGIENDNLCPNCYSKNGKKLNFNSLKYLINEFFRKGSVVKCNLGKSEIISYSPDMESSLNFKDTIKNDANLLSKTLQINFFHYAPRLCKIGITDVIEALEDPLKRFEKINHITDQYPIKILNKDDYFYRVRKFETNKITLNDEEFDSPPLGKQGQGRFDRKNFPVLYTSQNIEICLHECRTSASDDIYIATLCPIKTLKLVDFSHFLDENKSEFESIDFALNLIFTSNSKKAYELAKDIALCVKNKNFDGFIVPSFFSELHTGIDTFETQYGLSLRTIAQHYTEYKPIIDEAMIENIVLFGHPIKNRNISIKNINRIMIKKVKYDFTMGLTENDYV